MPAGYKLVSTTPMVPTDQLRVAVDALTEIATFTDVELGSGSVGRQMRSIAERALNSLGGQ